MRAVWITGLVLAMAASGQQAADVQRDDQTIQVDVNLVNLFCSVQDKHGAYITNLGKERFKVYEDGKEQEIRYFSQETDLPLTIGMLVDVSKSQENLLETEKRAASAFFRDVLRQKKDLAFLISFGAEAELLQDLTGSATLLNHGLDDLRLSVPVSVYSPTPTTLPSNPRGTILYDAVYLAANERLKGEVGRKVIVLITDGVDTGSRVSRDEAIRAAHRADAIIYSIYYVDQSQYGFGSFGGGGDGDLKKLAEESGGKVFRVDRKNTLEDIFKQIQEEMRSQYAIGYASSNPARDGGFRKIEIKTDTKDYKVAARKGYYALSSGKAQ